MEIAEAKINIIELRNQLAQIETEYDGYKKIYLENKKMMDLCENRKKDISNDINRLTKIIETENMFESVQEVEGFETLSQKELLAISIGMDKRDYRKYGNYPRYKDLEQLIKEVINFKIMYPGWILDRVVSCGQYDTLPPETFYRYTFKTPQGHSWSHGGIQILS
jgi:hypothetical protein